MQRLHRRLQSTQTLTSVAASEDVTLVATGHAHSAVRLHSLTEVARAAAPGPEAAAEASVVLDTGSACKDLWGHEGPVYGASFAYDGRLLYTAGCDGTVRIWATEMGANVALWQGHQQPVWAVQANPHGHWVASGGADWTCRLWYAPLPPLPHLLPAHALAIHLVCAARARQALARAQRIAPICTPAASAVACSQV